MEDEPLLILQRVSLRYLSGVPSEIDASRNRFGDLYIYPGQLGVRVRQLGLRPVATERVLTQIGGVVKINESLFPPWFNNALCISGPKTVVGVGIGGRPRTSLYAALNQACLAYTVRRRSYLRFFDFGP